MEKQDGNACEFEYNWVIENFHISLFLLEKSFRSPNFVLDSLPGTSWYIECGIASFHMGNFVTFSLKQADHVLEACTINYDIQGLNRDRKLCFRKKNVIESRSPDNSFEVLPTYINCSIFNSLTDDILIIKFVLKRVRIHDFEEFFPQFSYENILFTDTELRSNDENIKVHKAILWARWPKLAETVDAEGISHTILDFKPGVLETLIKYVYTGKLDYSKHELLEDLYSAALKYELLSLISPSLSGQKVRTRINVEKTSFNWPIKNFSSLPVHTILHSQMFIVNKLNFCGWYLAFQLREDAMHGRLIDISICKLCSQESEPVVVKCKISFEGKSYENEHLFVTDKKWKCVEFSRSISTDPEDILLLQCELMFLNSSYISETVESSYTVPSTVHYGSFRNELRNLYKSGRFSDISLLVDSKTFHAHKFVLCARSSVFSRMFETEMVESEEDVVEIVDIDSDIIEEMLLYVYSGCLEKPLEETADRLYAAADKYDISPLKKKCASFLKSHLCVANACRNLQLANFHSDNDLYESVLEFICSHVEDVFSTDDWKKFVKDNLVAQCVQEMVIRIAQKK
ncbi:Speckle-type POZ protein B, partial [Stegodyphus mimosarum]